VIIGASKIARDISGQKAALRSSLLLAAIVGSSDDAIISKTLDGTVTSWNKAAERMFGYTAQEMIGHPITTLFPEDRLQEEPKIIEQISRGQRIEHFETIRKTKDGRLLDISLTISPIKDASGRIIGASKIARNITKQKAAEAALARRTQTLEILNRTAATLAVEHDTEKLLQAVTDGATKAIDAEFGAFFFNAMDERGESYMLFTISGAPKEAFAKMGYPRATPLFGPTFRGEGVIRIANVHEDSRYGKWAPHHGMPQGHLPVVSYLAVPVTSRSGTVLGGLFFGHPRPDAFSQESEDTVLGFAAQASVALDNAKLYHDLEKELAEHKKAEAALRQSESQFRSLAESLPQ
jgi:PAS domain S-box-containing protein